MSKSRSRKRYKAEHSLGCSPILLACVIFSLAFLWAVPAFPQDVNPERAVGRVGDVLEDGRVHGCSFVMISPDGYALSAEHCTVNDTNTAIINGNRYQVDKVWNTTPKQGIDEGVIFDIDVKDHDYARVSKSDPEVGDRVWTIGFPIKENKPRRVRLEGVITAIESDYIITDITSGAGPGHSGGPLFNSNGEVIGLMGGGRDTDLDNFVDVTWWVGLNHIHARLAEVGYQDPDSTPIAVADQSKPKSDVNDRTEIPTVHVLVSPNCMPCERFKRDHRNGKFGDLKVDYVQVGSRDHQILFPNVNRTPAFRIRDEIQIGYQSPRDVIGLVAAVIRVSVKVVRGILGLIAGDEPEPVDREPPNPSPTPTPEPSLGSGVSVPEELKDLPSKVQEISKKIDIINTELQKVEGLEDLKAKVAKVDEIADQVNQVSQRVDDPPELPQDVQAAINNGQSAYENYQKIKNGWLPQKVTAGLALKKDIQQLKSDVPNLKEHLLNPMSILSVLGAIVGWLRRRKTLPQTA